MVIIFSDMGRTETELSQACEGVPAATVAKLQAYVHARLDREAAIAVSAYAAGGEVGRRRERAARPGGRLTHRKSCIKGIAPGDARRRTRPWAPSMASR